MRRCLVILFTAVTLLGAAGCAGDEPVARPSTAVTTTVASDVDLSCAKPGVVRPNCGVKPQNAGDRGGALQYTVWALLVIGLIVVFTVVFRSAGRTDRAKRAEVGDRNWS